MTPADARSAPPFENRSLFSDHYLRERLDAHPQWGDDVAAAWEAARELWAAARPRLEGANEAQTEEEWIKPVLRHVLGWELEVQPEVAGIRGRRSINRPDYALFADEAKRAAAHGAAREAYWTHAAAVADAKAWERPLDGGAAESNANPSFQVVAYLFLTGVDWAVLTNGREWRLYSRRARSRVDVYYAVDLVRLLEEGGREGFRWFVHFFRAAAFRPGGFLDAVLDESAAYGAALEVRLKKLIFSEVFETLAAGFLRDRARQGLAAGGDEVLREVYEGTLRLLYRVLFLLHAEARDLLPVRSRGYQRYSLAALREKVAQAAAEGGLSERATDVWDDLRVLFRIVDEGDPGIGVPRYNGGLFRADHPRNRFLAEHSVADAFLVPALDGLSRDEGGHFVDYKALDVEQLGSLYEGLLEFRLKVGDDGKPFLENDKGERHATGSYYTPHYVVEYIVAETVGPVLEARAEAFRAAMGELTGPRAPADAALRLERAAEALLSIRICDPAMGSGHFLVHAANWLTEALIAFLSEFPENPVLARLGAIRREIVGRLAAEGIAVDPAHLRDTALLKRMVIKRCIYGVDLNPMATELAKLSLWLDSFTVGAPLSFLDHHLKHGNSLVGTRVLDVSRAMQVSELGEYDVFGGPFSHVLRAAELMRGVAARTDATFEEVAESATQFAEFEAVMEPYKRLLDLWVSRDFGNRLAGELASSYGNEVLEWARGRAVKFNREQKAALARAEELRRGQRFFHWDLEFPEVFVDLERASWKENPGFDVVIGNPPYVRQEQVKALKPYFASAYRDVHDGAADLYVYFYREGMELLRRGGRMSYIVTNKWLRAGYGEGLRRFFAERARVERIVDFGHAPIFPDADVFPCIVVVERPEEDAAPAAAGETQVTIFPRTALQGGPIGEYVAANAYPVATSRFGSAPWSLERPDVNQLVEKMRIAGVPLHDFAGASPLYGVKTGFNDAFLIDTALKEQLIREHPSSTEIIKPYLRGQDIERWSPRWPELWMIFSRRGIDIDRYPAIKKHLAAFRTKLTPKPESWDDAVKGKWEGRKAGSYAWYELQDTVDYWRRFEKPKIIWKDLSFHSQFCFDDQGFFTNDLCFILPSADRWLLAVLNSPLMWTFMWRSVVHGKDEVLRLKSLYMETLPIASPPDAETESEAEAAVERLIELTNEQRHANREVLDWLRTEFGIDKPGQKLAKFGDLNADDFVAEVRARRPRRADPLTPREVAALRNAHGEYAPKLVELAARAAGLERRLAQLVNQAYGLTPEEVELMWSTAPPRMPVGR